MLRTGILLILLHCIAICYGMNDTLKITLKEADSLFLRRNLLLLAEQYNIESAEALIQQAGLWNNPSLYTEWSAYNTSTKQFADIGKSGQKIISVEQVVSLAGKRNKRISLAGSDKEMNRYVFLELIRTLKFQLHSNYYNIYFNLATVQNYNRQLTLLEKTISAFEAQYEKNNLSLKEIVRLKAVYFQLYNDRTKLLASVSDEEKELQTLLQTQAFILPQDAAQTLERYSIEKIKNRKPEELALLYRPDLKMAECMLSSAQINYRLQKSLAVPDLRISGTYDQAGSYTNHYLGLGIGIDLPVFNRNQGNIKYANAQIHSQEYQKQNTELNIKNEVTSALLKLKEIETEYQQVDKTFHTQFEQLNTGLIANFEKRNLSLIEFVDLFEAYNESIKQLNILNAWRIETYEEVNYTVGTELFE